MSNRQNQRWETEEICHHSILRDFVGELELAGIGSTALDSYKKVAVVSFVVFVFFVWKMWGITEKWICRSESWMPRL